MISRWAGRLGIMLATVAAASSSPSMRARRRAAPGVIVFTGSVLRGPVVLRDWTENQRLMMALVAPVTVDDAIVAHRPRLSIAMYWGAEWSQYAGTPDSLALLARRREAQLGVYYPAWRDAPAVWVFGPMGAMPGSRRRVGEEGLRILRAHHLPTSMQ